MKDEGGGAPDVRNAALLLSRGAIVGALVDETGMESRLLCPGTPSNVPVPGDWVLSDFTGRVLTGVTGVWPRRNEAARVIRGAIVGAAVEATDMVPERLWPGTSIKRAFCCSLVGATLGFLGTASTAIPARKAAARVVRGTISGDVCVMGRGRALNCCFPPFVMLALRDVPPGEVAFEGA